MEGVNKVTLIGSVGGDAELKTFSEGKTLVTFRLATNRSYKDGKTGEKKSETQWHTIKAWGPMAENMGKLIKKGTNLYLEGEIQYSEYEAKEGGKRWSTAIMAKSFNLLPSSNRNADGAAGTEAAATKSVNDFKASDKPEPTAQTVSATNADVMGGGDDDLPF